MDRLAASGGHSISSAAAAAAMPAAELVADVRLETRGHEAPHEALWEDHNDAAAAMAFYVEHPVSSDKLAVLARTFRSAKN